MAITVKHKDYRIEVFDDSSFTRSKDGSTSYDKIYQPKKDKGYKSISQHAVITYCNDLKLNSAIILASGEATSITSNSVLVTSNNLVLRCSNWVFSLTIPELELNWMTQVDGATCFSIHKYKNDIIAHGDMSVSRIGKHGKQVWEFIGADIFVTADGSSAFDMRKNYILLKDLNGGTYKVSYDGISIAFTESDYYKQNQSPC